MRVIRFMILLDTVKCGLPESLINDIDIQACKDKGTLIKKPGNMDTEIKLNESLPIGINEIKIELFQEDIKKVVIKFSAKILKSEYKKLISKNTIEEVGNNINKNSFIQFKPQFLWNAKVFRVDPVNDLYLHEPEKGIQAISLLRNNNKYLIRIYGKYESVLFIRNAKTIKESLLFYRKGIELKLIRNKQLLLSFNQADIEYFSKIIRVEQRINSFKQIRAVFNISDNYLSNVLLSESKPNFDLYKKIKGDIDFSHDIITSENIKQLLWTTLIKYYKSDINTIEAVLKPLVGKNISCYRKRYIIPLLNKLLFQNLNESGFTEILKDIEDQLSA